MFGFSSSFSTVYSFIHLRKAPLLFLLIAFSFSSISGVWADAKKQAAQEGKTNGKKAKKSKKKKKNKTASPVKKSKQGKKSKKGKKKDAQLSKGSQTHSKKKRGFKASLFSLRGSLHFDRQGTDQILTSKVIQGQSLFSSSFQVSPRLGYFVKDNFELALITRFGLDSLSDEKDVALSSSTSFEFALNPTYYLTIDGLAKNGLYPLIHAGIGYKMVSEETYDATSDQLQETALSGLMILGGAGLSWVKGKPKAGQFTLTLLFNYEYNPLDLENADDRGVDWSFIQTRLFIGMLF